MAAGDDRGTSVATNAQAATFQRPSIGGIASAERASLYSGSGIAPALTSERNSYYAGKQGNNTGGDGGSVRSGLLGHGRNDSITGSIGGVQGAGSPLASPVPTQPGKISRRSSGWGEVPGEEEGENEEDEDDGVDEGEKR